MRTLSTFFLIIFICQSNICQGQLYFDKKPYNPIYSEIQFAHLPDPEASRKGHIFFNIKRDSYNQFATARSIEALQKIVIPNLPIRYPKNKYHFTDHQILEEELVSASGSQLKSISDTLFVAITATRNLSKWSWRKFSMILRPVGTDTLYKGYVASISTLRSSNLIYDYLLKADSVHLALKATYGPDLDQVHSTFGWPARASSLLLPINELLPRQHYLVSGLDVNKFNIAITKTGITMYSQIKQ